MALIKSISGIRGTIGGRPDDNLTPLDIVKFTAAYGAWVLEKTQNKRIVLGRDARISGQMVNNLVIGTLQGLGIEVIDLGLSTTPTVEIAVPMEQAGGGIILTASHNPKQWNALKLLNEKGEFISGENGAEVLAFELDLNAVTERAIPVACELSKYPSVRRDLALVVPENTPWAALEASLKRALGPLLREVLLFDRYVGTGLEPGSKSLAMGLILQDVSRTLTDQESESAVQNALAGLAKDCGAKLRG